MMNTPITVPRVLAAFASLANRDTFLRGGGRLGEAAAAATLLLPPPRWMRSVISPSLPPPSCFVPVDGGVRGKLI